MSNYWQTIVFCTKIEELGDSEYQRKVGRPYNYSMARMQELRREASRYREAHVGRARDSWVTLSRAIRNRRRRDLKMLTLPLDQLAARLPPSRPTKISIAAEVASLNSFAESSSAAGELIHYSSSSNFYYSSRIFTTIIKSFHLSRFHTITLINSKL